MLSYPENQRDIDGDGNDDVWDLRLYYNYQPGKMKKYTAGSSSLLINNVSVFKMTAYAYTVRFKICVKQFIGESKPITICKEKAVVR